jgi:type IV secretion system protein VirD4
MRNYAGHRLAPWLAHVMVSRQETSRPLLTPGEVMQLDPADELVLLSGLPPIRAKKLRYFEDRNFTVRVAEPPALRPGGYVDRPAGQADDWSGRVACAVPDVPEGGATAEASDGGLSQELRPVARRRRPRPIAPEQLDLLGLGDDDAAAPLDPSSPLTPMSPVLAAHAANEGRGGADLVPSF